VVGIAPGRVEILGNHTDYNGGAVLTAAVDRYVVVVGRPTSDPRVRAWSINLEAAGEFPLADLRADDRPDWTSYVKSVFAMLDQADVRAGGMDLVIASNVPAGAGLSSSAALEAAVARAVLQAYPAHIEPLALARLLQRGENEYAKVQCGLLDQFSTIHGQADRVVYLDCASAAHETLSLGTPAPAIVVVDSRVSRQLGHDAPYNTRRRECEQAKAALERELGRRLDGLCAATPAQLEQAAAAIPEPPRSRARHVIGEHERVLAAKAALAEGDVARLGRLMEQSHQSSQRFFENSCDALDRLCLAASGQPGYLGGRLCGGGWGGCTVNLVTADRVDDFRAGMTQAVSQWPDPKPVVHVCFASDGATGHTLS
jgi:galactokinase